MPNGEPFAAKVFFDNQDFCGSVSPGTYDRLLRDLSLERLAIVGHPYGMKISAPLILLYATDGGLVPLRFQSRRARNFR
jgi:hypothetical protein